MKTRKRMALKVRTSQRSWHGIYQEIFVLWYQLYSEADVLNVHRVGCDSFSNGCRDDCSDDKPTEYTVYENTFRLCSGVSHEKWHGQVGSLFLAGAARSHTYRCRRHIFTAGIDYNGETYQWHPHNALGNILGSPAVWPYAILDTLDAERQAVARRFVAAKICGQTHMDR